MSWRVEAFLLLDRFGIHRKVDRVLFWMKERFRCLDDDSLTVD